MSEDQPISPLVARQIRLFEAEWGKLAERLAEATGEAQRQVQAEAEAVVHQLRAEAAETAEASRQLKAEAQEAREHLREAEGRLRRVQAELESDGRMRASAFLRQNVSAAVAEIHQQEWEAEDKATQAEDKARATIAEVERAAARLKAQLAQGASDARLAALNASQEGVEAAQVRVARLEDRLDTVEQRGSLQEAAVAQMPRVVVLATVALVSLALGAGAAVWGASARRDDALQEAIVAEAQADELRAMGRTLQEDYGFGLARRNGEVVLTLPEGSRMRRVVPVVGAVLQQGSIWRIDRD